MSSVNRGQDAGAAERRVQALELRKRGKSFRQIAAELSVSESTAHKYVTIELKRLNAEAAESAEEVRRMELERLDRYLERLDKRIEDGNDKAVGIALRVQERRAKLLGLDTPDRHEVTVSDMSPDEIARSLLLGSGKG